MPIPVFGAGWYVVVSRVLTCKLTSHVQMVLYIVGSTESMSHKNVCFCEGCRSGNMKLNGIPCADGSEGVDNSVSVEDCCGNGPLGGPTRGDHLPTNAGDLFSAGEENALASNDGGLESDCVFESIVDTAAAGSSTAYNYVVSDAYVVIMFSRLGSNRVWFQILLVVS